MRAPLRPHAAGVVAFAAVLLCSACDSTDADDDPRPADVAGVYTFTGFSFDPTGSGIELVNVLDTLVAEETSLELLDSGQFILRYRFVGGSQQVVSGVFDVDEEEITLSAEGDLNARLLGDILLADPITLERNELTTVLSADFSTTANLEAFSEDRYAGLTSVPGRMQLGLALQ